MQQQYPFKQIEADAQQYWEANQTFAASETQTNQNITACRCFRTLLAACTWGMCGTTPSAMC